MTPAARLQAAIELLGEVEAGERPADGVVSAYLRTRRYIGGKDRREIVERVYGVLRRRARLDWWLKRAGLRPTMRLRVLACLMLADALAPKALANLFDGSRHAPDPLSPAEKRLADGLAGRALEAAEMPDWVRGEYPEWLEPALRDALGADFREEMAALRDEAPLDLRVNTLKASREEAKAALAAEGLAARETPLSPLGLRLAGRVNLPALKVFRDGLVEVQDEGSQLASLLVAARPGQAVLDYCAGAGGKTLALAAGMENRGRLLACDIAKGRIDRGRDRFRRAGIHNARTLLLDADGRRQLRRRKGSFDRVLVDAPCTGTGTWRRNPDAKWRLRPEDLDALAATQAAILDEVAPLVRPGGRLVYVTCSLLPQENRLQVESFLARHTEYRPLPVAEVWAETVGGRPPVGEAMLQLSPYRHGTDGFFVAVMQRGEAASAA